MMINTDQADVTAVLYRAARAMDSRDWDLLADCYAPDARGDYTNAVAEDRDAILASARGFLGTLDATQHLVGNVEVTVDGDTATTHATFIAQHVRAGGHFLMGGNYDDTLRRTADGWKITNRRIRGIWADGDPAVLTVAVS
ncbi:MULTISPECIES: nuclear transport factor 2 family protein [Actinoplanes]|uniref:nuclear transport factor 2 family protein n=1 Tax=Actinoplanes TaxID=1865 RepID=UPI0005F2E7CD|nr:MULTISPECIES: nuclear transport factor 2 family protein [Actinoplanes]GLY00406.1 bile-acid 7-alpha-dehydratase [Actinoplanes sp. NBRC 101535]